MLKIIRGYFRRGKAIRLPSSHSSYARLVDMLGKGEPFAFSRWGDGEWESVLGVRGESDANCDGHQYFASMKESLHGVLTSAPRYFLGMQKLAYHKLLGREIDAYLKQYEVNAEWLNADAFHDASRNGEIKSFFDLLKDKRILLVGPSHLRRVTVFSFDFCEVPEKNCWLDKDKILGEIKERIKGDNPQVVLFCAGMTSNWFIDQLHKGYHGFLIDLGSLLDPYAGRNTRNYHKKLAGISPEQAVPGDG